MSQGKEIEVIPSQVLTTKDAMARRKALEAYVSECLIEGVDYSVDERDPNKKNLLQAGADKVLNLYALTSRADVVEQTEIWDPANPFFYYKVKSTIIWPRRMEDGSIREEVIAEGFGSCNSKETKYAWRWFSREEMSKEMQVLADKGTYKTETREKNVPWFTLTDEEKKRCAEEKWKQEDAVSKGGKTYVRVDHPGVVMYRTPNEDIFDQVNTILKIGKKRSYVDATIRATKAGDLFTQDLEDLPGGRTIKKAEKVEAKEEKKDHAKHAEKPGAKTPEKEEPKKTYTVAEIEKTVATFKGAVKECKSHNELNAVYKEVAQDLKQHVFEFYSVRYKEISKDVAGGEASGEKKD